MSNPINNSAPQYPGSTLPRPPGLRQPGAASAATHRLSDGAEFDDIPRNFSGRAITVVEPPSSNEYEHVKLKVDSNRVKCPGIYLPTDPIATPPERIISAMKNPNPTYFPSAVFTPESGGNNWTPPNPDHPDFNSEVEVPEHWGAWAQPFAPLPGGPKLPKPRLL